MNAVLASAVMLIPTGWIASLRIPGMANSILVMIACFAGSMTVTVPPISDDTHSSEPARLNSGKRGRASTSTLATIWRDAVSMKCAMLVVSDVLMRNFPSGLIAMPSGSTPTWTSPTRARCCFGAFGGTGVVVLIGSVENLPRRILHEQFGIGPRGQGVRHLRGCGI